MREIYVRDIDRWEWLLRAHSHTCTVANGEFVTSVRARQSERERENCDLSFNSTSITVWSLHLDIYVIRSRGIFSYVGQFATTIREHVCVRFVYANTTNEINHWLETSEFIENFMSSIQYRTGCYTFRRRDKKNSFQTRNFGELCCGRSWRSVLWLLLFLIFIAFHIRSLTVGFETKRTRTRRKSAGRRGTQFCSDCAFFIVPYIPVLFRTFLFKFSSLLLNFVDVRSKNLN